jgi:hypothetical protein
VRVPLHAVSRYLRGRGNSGSNCLDRGRSWFLDRNGGFFCNRRGRNHSRLSNGLGGLCWRNRRDGNLSDRDFGGGRNGFRSWNRRCGERNRRLDHHGHCGRRHGDCRTRRGYGAGRSLGDHRTYGWTSGNGGRSRRMDDDGGRGARLGNNLARFRLGRHRGWRRGDHNRRHWTHRCLYLHLRRGGCRPPLRQMALPCFGFVFQLFSQDGLQHIAGLGDM